MSDLRVKKREEEDRLSQLPNAILGHILSYLSRQEAARTSVLSASWRHLWLLFVSDFDFELIRPEDLTSLNYGAFRDRFFDGVDRVVQSHRDLVEALPLQKFRLLIQLCMAEHHLGMIDEWVSYAFAKRVRNLELDFIGNIKFIRIVAESETDLSFLRSLSLSGVSVSKQDFDSILLNCHSLEYLKVLGTRSLKSVEIGSSCPALKHVEILDCLDLERVVVRDTCLVSLTLGLIPELEVVNNPVLVSLTVDIVGKHLVQENNPKLVSACFSYWDLRSDPAFRLLCLSRLHTLTLCLRDARVEVFAEVPKLSELKHLTLIVAPDFNKAPRLACLLKLSPNLQKLGLQLAKQEETSGKKLKYEKGPKVVLPHLKTIEVWGYRGEEAEDELIKYALEHVAAPIQTTIFDPRDYFAGLKRVIPSSFRFFV